MKRVDDGGQTRESRENTALGSGLVDLKIAPSDRGVSGGCRDALTSDSHGGS